MTIEEFTRITRRCRLSARGLESARAVLVDGRTQSDVAREQQIPRQYVFRSCRAVLRKRKTLNNRKMPPGWVSVTVIVPRPVAKRIKAMAAHETLTRPHLKTGRKLLPKNRPKPVKPKPAQVPDVAGVSAIARALLGLQIQSTTAEET